MTDINNEIISRVHIATEIMTHVICETKAILEESLGKVNNYYDGEKKNVLGIAQAIFEYSVTPEDIRRLSKDSESPNIIDVSKDCSPKQACCGNNCSTDSSLLGDGARL